MLIVFQTPWPRYTQSYVLVLFTKQIKLYLLICYAAGNHIAYYLFCEIIDLIALRVSALHLVLACFCLSLDTDVERADGLFVSLAHVRQGYSSYHCVLRPDGECFHGAARTSFSLLLSRLLPAARVRSFLNSSSQHSSSCATTSGPTSFLPVFYSHSGL